MRQLQGGGLRLLRKQTRVSHHRVVPVAGCPDGTTPTTQSVPQSFNANAIPKGDCLWLNNKLVPSDSICAAATSSKAPVVISVSGQTVTYNGVTVQIPGWLLLACASTSKHPNYKLAARRNTEHS